jgi:hypothetical protein
MRRYLTVGQIAREVGCPIWQAQYLLRTRKVKAAGKVGFSPKVIKLLQTELEKLRTGKRA